jgi:hypothetical protein
MRQMSEGMSPLLIHELSTRASAQLNVPYGALPLLYPGANDQPPIHALVVRFQQQCPAVTIMLLLLMTDAEHVPEFVNNLPTVIDALCARATPEETAIMIRAATHIWANLEKYGFVSIAILSL